MANTTIYPYGVGGVAVRRFRPCSYNGVAGMHDTVNDVFYSNANTLGFFVLDND